MDLTGFLLINKAIGKTSFDCVRTLRKLLPRRTKVGHAGTLDDFAQGLLIVCIGRNATKSVGTLMNLDKEYIVRAKLGELTDSLDLTGQVVKTVDVPLVTSKDLEIAFKNLMPSYEQVPPIYSALKHEGRPLYKLARYKRVEPEVLEKISYAKKREVFLYETEILEVALPFFTFRAKVSKGTYVRSLAHDLASKLNLPATTYDLTRSKIGSFTLDQAKNLEDFNSCDDIKKNLKQLAIMF